MTLNQIMTVDSFKSKIKVSTVFIYIVKYRILGGLNIGTVDKHRNVNKN